MCLMSGPRLLSSGDQVGRRILPTAGGDPHQYSITAASDPGLGLPLLPW